jgi:AcrR family transcriptional regulator
MRKNAKEQLLDAASELFYRDGVRAVGVDKIVAESGVSKMTLYSHFGSKELLVAAWLDRSGRTWMAWLEAAVERRGGGVVAVFDALREWFESPGFRGCPFQNSQAELGNSSPLVRTIVRTNKQMLREYLERLAVSEGVEAPEPLARELLLLVEGAIVTASVEGDSAAASIARRVAARALADSLSRS